MDDDEHGRAAADVPGWVDGFTIGVPAIDAEHRRIFAAAGRIRDAIDAGDFAAVSALVDVFVSMAERHFRQEEAVLAGAGYPALPQHAREHAELLRQASAAGELCRSVLDRGRAKEAFDALIAFLVSDIVKADLEFKSFLEDAGVSEPPARPVRGTIGAVQSRSVRK